MVLLIIGVVNVQAQTGYAIIRGKVNSATDKDSILVTVNKFGYPFYYRANESYVTPIQNHRYFFRIRIGKYPIHFNLDIKERVRNDSNYVKLYNLSLHNYYLESGDNITISENGGIYSFAGKNAKKFRIIGALDNIGRKINTGLSWDDPNNAKLYFEKQDLVFIKRSDFIDSQRAFISPDIYILLKADAFGNYLSRWSFINLMRADLIEAARNNLNGYHSTVPKSYLIGKKLNKYDVVKFSDSYTDGVVTKYKFDSCTVPNRPYTLHKSYDYLTHNFSGGMEERLVINEIYGNKDSKENLVPFVDQALDFVTFPEFKAILIGLKSTRLAGAPAFNFNLPDASGRIRSFSEFKGKVVLLDFWFTGCGTCRLSAPFLEKVELNFIGKQVVFLTINLDDKREVWIKTIREGTYTSKFGIDLFTNGENFNHPISKYYNIEGCPSFILVNKKGELMANLENPAMDNGAELTRLIETEINR